MENQFINFSLTSLQGFFLI